MASIVQIIDEVRDEVGRGNLLPERAAELLTTLSALLGNILEEITTNDMAYNQILMEYLEKEKTAANAKIKAGTTDEYRMMRTARNAEKTATGLIASLKYYLKSKEQEYRAGNNF